MVSRFGLVACFLGLGLVPALQAAEVTVLDVAGEVELSPGGDDSQAYALKGGETVRESDRIVTSMDSQARLKFADNSVVIVGELTDMKVAAFSDAGNLVHTRLWLRGGQVVSAVNKESERPSDFAVKTPTATAGVRGTTQSVFCALGTTQVGILNGMGYGTDAFGTETNINHGEEAETDDLGQIDGPDQQKSEDSRTDASAENKAFDEEEAFEESSPLYVQSPGLFGTAGDNSQGNQTIQDLSQGIQQQIAMASRGNIIADPGFDNPIGAPWVGTNIGAGTISISGGQANFQTSASGDAASLYQDIVFPTGGTYLLALDVVGASNLSSNDLVQVLFDVGGNASISGSHALNIPGNFVTVGSFSQNVDVNGAGSNRIEFKLIDGDGVPAGSFLDIDNVSLTPQ